MANKANEAKIRFTAETESLNKNMRQSKAEMAKLRAETKLNAETMQDLGATVEGLEKNHELLEKQLEVSKKETEDLSQKLQTAKKYFGENSVEVKSLETALLNQQRVQQKLERNVELSAEAVKQFSEMEKRGKTATESLTDTIENQQREVDDLKKEYSDAVLAYGKNSKEARELEKELNSLSSELKENKSKMAAAESAAEKLDRSLDDAGDGAENASDGFSVMKGALADLVSEGIQTALGKLNEFVDFMWGLPEQTRELRQDFATLDTAFANVGFSAETATGTWKELYKVFGEDDRAVEAANHIAKMSRNQEDLNAWVKITTGVWGTYQDSLPVEGLAEAGNETAKTGKVTGVLADALNWSSEAAEMFSKYMSEDVVTAEDAFNEALAECNTEQERQQLITETLTKLYGGAADEYRNASGAMMEAKDATAENTLAQAELAKEMEPVTTAWTELKTSLLEAVLPAIQEVSGALTDVLEWMNEHPKITAAAAAIGTAFAGIAGVAVAVGSAIGGISQIVSGVSGAFAGLGAEAGAAAGAGGAAGGAAGGGGLSGVIAACGGLAPALLIVAGIVAAVSGIVLILKDNWDKVTETFRLFAEKTGLNEKFEEIKESAKSLWESFKGLGDFLKLIAVPVFTTLTVIFGVLIGLFDGIVSALSPLMDMIGGIIDIFAGWGQVIMGLFTGDMDKVKAGFETFVGGIWATISNLFVAVWELLKGFFVGIVSFFGSLFEAIGLSDMLAGMGEVISQWWAWLCTLFSTVGTWIYDNVIAPVAQFFTDLWNGIVNGVISAWNWVVGILSTVGTWIYDNIIAPVVQFFTDLWNGIVTAYHTVIDPWIEIVKRLSAMFYENVIQPVAQFFVDLWNGITAGLQAAWDWIVELALTVAGWIDENVIQPVTQFFTDLWTGIKDGATAAWDGIKNVFFTIKGWVNEKVIQPVTGFFTKLWDGFKNGASKAWEGVKNVFSAVGGFFSTVFGIVKDKIVSVFQAGGKVFNNIKDGIVNVFKTVVNGIIQGLNKVIKVPFQGLNSVLDTIHNVTIVGVQPFSWLTWRAPIPKIPLLAEGGILTSPTLNIAGEAGPEAVIPLDRLQSFIDTAVDRSLQMNNLQSLVYAVEDLANRAIELNINGKHFATATASDTDRVNGNRVALSKMGLALG